MKFSLAKKALVLALSAVLPIQPVLASLAESNIWKERREATEKARPENKRLQMAALPASLNPQSILKQLPPINTTLPTSARWSETNKNKSLGFPQRLQELLDSIPLVYGTIQDVYNSGNEKISPVVLIQDVHLNSEAQNNIASVLQELINQKQVGLVGVEGAFSPFDFKRFRAFSDKHITKEVSKAFLNKNLLAAPSFVGITSPIEPPRFIGVDDLEHYKANVEAYLSTIALKGKTKKKIEVMKNELSKKKAHIFSPELRNFDDLRTAHHAGNIGFGVYVKKLSSYSVEKEFVVDQFLEAYEMESTLDFKKVDEERKAIIEKLTRVLKEEELSNLLTQSMAYRMGRISFGTYYQNLKNLSRSKAFLLKKLRSLIIIFVTFFCPMGSKATRYSQALTSWKPMFSEFWLKPWWRKTSPLKVNILP